MHQPLLTRDQARLIRDNQKGLKGLAEPVQNAIAGSHEDGALVVAKPAAAPLILPSSGPLTAAMDHGMDVAAGQSCYFVYRRTIPVPPQQVHCGTLARDADRLTQINLALKKLDAGLQQANRDITSMSKVLAPTAALVQYHETQLTSMEKSFGVLKDAYDHSASTIATNNQHTERIVSDMNWNFARISTVLGQMQRRLKYIK